MKLYGSTDCLHCRSIKNLLNSRGLPFEFIDLGPGYDDTKLETDDGQQIVGFENILSYLQGR